MKIDSTRLGPKRNQVLDPMLAAMVTGDTISMAQARAELKELPIKMLQPWSDEEHPAQPFRPYSKDALQELAGDIAENGVIQPVIVRPWKGQYQILAGHNRVAAAALAGLSTVPCIVRDVDDATAVRVLTQTNLKQREKLLPSEKAFAYKLLADSTRSQGKRSDLTLGHSVPKWRSDNYVAQQMGESGGKAVQRYIRLTYLIPPLLALVDTDNIGFVAGVALSFLNAGQQCRLVNVMAQFELSKITKSQAEELKTYREELDEREMRRILDVEISAVPKVRTVSIRIPKEMLPAGVPAYVLSDALLLQRISAVVGSYVREQGLAV